MFRELLSAYERFVAEGKIPPTAYKPKQIKWVVELSAKAPVISGPFTGDEMEAKYAPDRGRQGKVSASNLKPFLLVDKAQYALGVSPPEKEADTELAHNSFVALLEEAWRQTGDDEIDAVLKFVRSPAYESHEIEPNDIVAFRVDPVTFPFEKPHIQSFWASYLSDELKAEHPSICGVCGSHERVLRLFPRELVVLGQKCQVTSFNLPAFVSFGRQQTENSPICFRCGSAVTDALDYMVRAAEHRSVLARRRAQDSSLQGQLAVYWLSRPIALRDEGAVITEAAFKAVLAEEFRSNEDERLPLADLRHVENLLRVPWVPMDASLYLRTESFHLAVLSANKGRLVVREWLSVSLADLRERLQGFLAALRLIGFYGDEPRARSIAAIVGALDSHDPNLTRGLLRTAYLGHAPPSALLGTAVSRLTALWLKGKQDRPNAEGERIRHIEALSSAVKLALFYGKEDEQMEQLTRNRKTAPYLSGVLLAVLEEAQQRASNWNLNTTIVDRFYGSASTAPCSVFGNLIRLATTAHLPEVGRDVNVLMEDVMRDLDEAGGFPPTLTAQEQADFALGFYHQRADFRAKRKQKQVDDPPARESN